MAENYEADDGFETLIRYIQESRGVDFRGYKRTSLRRRVSLRMEQIGVDGFDAYHAFLEVHPQEFVELLNTVLINVTSFFRDADAWEVLRTDILPRLLAADRGRDVLRVWSAGCASGEEPYSLAMLLSEAMDPGEFAARVKIYATDLDEGALNTARHAAYSPRDIEPIPNELVEKYFERTNNHYVVNRDLRKAVIFGRHNIVHDAPISRVDLLVCRNLLIYLETETQNIVLPRLHYALVDDGMLFLGKAETQLARSKLFEPVNMKHRLFHKLPQEWRRIPGGSVVVSGARNGVAPAQINLLEAIVGSGPTAYLALGNDDTLIFANPVARRMLDVGEADIGRPFQDLPISYRPTELRSRIDEARRLNRPVRIEHQEYHRPPAEPVRISIDILPLLNPDGNVFATLLSFNETTRTFMLQQELDAAQESLETTIEELQSANEELETTNEELQSTNEELETTNEELQSTNEELETTNEELRSTNEELEAANEEQQRQSDDSGAYRAHSESILRSVDAGIIVLDRSLRVQSWNRWSENVWGLRQEEVVGHSFLDLDIGFHVRNLESGLSQTLDGHTDVERQLSGVDRRGRPIHCRVRMSSLLSEDRSVRGIVVIIEDRTEMERHQQYAAYLGRITRQALNEIYFLDPDTLRFTLVNEGAEKKLGYNIGQLQRMSLPDLMPQVSPRAVNEALRPLLNGERQEVVLETTLHAGTGRSYPAQICFQYLDNEHPPLLLAFVQDTSERQRLAS